MEPGSSSLWTNNILWNHDHHENTVPAHAQITKFESSLDVVYVPKHNSIMFDVCSLEKNKIILAFLVLLAYISFFWIFCFM